MAHVRYKFALQPAGLLRPVHQLQQFPAGGGQLRHHVVESFRKIVYFVPGSERRSLLQITLRYQPREIDQAY